MHRRRICFLMGPILFTWPILISPVLATEPTDAETEFVAHATNRQPGPAIAG